MIIEEPSDLSVYPIPAENLIYINGVQEGSTILVHDINGRVLITESEFYGSINIENLNTGVYFIKILNSNSKVLRFIKK